MKTDSMTPSSRRLAAALAVALGCHYVGLGVQAQETSPAGYTMDGTAWNCSGWYTIVSGDSCSSVEQAYNITQDQFLEWNTAVSSDCSTNFWTGYSYCVRVGAPGPTMDGIAENCDAWVTIVAGEDTCTTIQQDYNITLAEFLEWNPAVSEDCTTNFWADYSYCVGIDEDESSTTSISSTVTATSTTIGSITSAVSVNTTTTPYSTRNPVTSYNLTAPYTETANPPTHTLGGHPSYCNAWHEVTGHETCQNIVNYYGSRLTMEQL